MDKGEVTIDKTLEWRNRNRTIQIDCNLERGENYLIQALREVALLDEEGKRYPADDDHDYVYEVSRNLADIQGDEVTLPAEYGGITLTAAQVAKALEMLSDVYADEDDPHPGSSSSSA